MPDIALLAGLGIALDEKAAARLTRFHALLLEQNALMDLTKVPEAEMGLRHYADSLLVLRHGFIKPGDRLIDVGSGAGFPGLPLAIARPDVQVTLLESKQKRCAFLQTVIDTLGLDNASVLYGRAEELAVPPQREAYDIAMARALAPLNLLAEFLLPFVRVGGMALCWKGPAIQEELADGRFAAKALGGALGKLADLNIPGRSHYIQAINKLQPTPKQYPRKAGIPAKNPLAVKR